MFPPKLSMEPVKMPGVQPLGGGPILQGPEEEQQPMRHMAMPQPQAQPMSAPVWDDSPKPQRPAKPQGGGFMAPPKQAEVAPVQTVQAATTGASVGDFDVSKFRPFSDAVYSEATRQLDPMMQQREADFRQRMVNQGLQEGTDAFDKAYANFSRERNDAYGSARNQALAQALGAQNQFFGQSATNAQMANQASLANAQMANQNNLANAQMGLQTQLANIGNRMNWGQFGANMAQRESEFGRNMDFQGQRADMADLMGLLGYGQQATAFNNAQQAQDQQRASALFGLIPGLGPTQLDVMGPANQFMQMQQANIAGANARQNGVMGALGQLGGSLIGGAAQTGGWSFLSDVRAKTDITKVGKLDNGLNVYVYRYKSGGPMQIGVMAQEVETIKPHAVIERDGFKHVDYAEAVK